MEEPAQLPPSDTKIKEEAKGNVVEEEVEAKSDLPNVDENDKQNEEESCSQEEKEIAVENRPDHGNVMDDRDSDVIVEDDSEEHSQEEAGYQSENESESESEPFYEPVERLRKIDDDGYEEDHEGGPESDVSSLQREGASDGYEEEDIEVSSSVSGNEETDKDEKEETKDGKKPREKKKGSGEEESGDEKEGKKSPSFVPRRTDFWDHDDRFNDNSVEETRGRPGKKLWDKTSDRWGHDKYKEEEQGPKEPWELEESKREQEFYENRRRKPRGGANFGDFMPRSRGGNDEQRDGDERRPPYRGRGGRGGRGVGRGGTRGRVRTNSQEEEFSEEAMGYRKQEEPRRFDDRAHMERREQKEDRWNWPPLRAEHKEEKPPRDKGSDRKPTSDWVTSSEKRIPSTQRERNDDHRRVQNDDHRREPNSYRSREFERNSMRDDQSRGQRQSKRRQYMDDGYRNERGKSPVDDEQDEEGYNWGEETVDNSYKKSSKNYESRRPKGKEEVKGRQERRPRRADEEEQKEQRREEVDHDRLRRQRRGNDENQMDNRFGSPPRQKGRGRGVMSESRARGSKTAEDFRKERPIRRRATRQADEDDRAVRDEEDDDNYVDAHEDRPSNETSKPSTKPKRYSSQRQRQKEREESGTGEGAAEENEAPENLAAGNIKFNPHLLSYIQHQLQQQQQGLQEAINSEMNNKNTTPATVQLLQQHILQMQQQMQHLQMQNAVLRRQQMEQEQQHHQQQHQQLFATGIPQLAQLNQQNPNIHAASFRGAPGMGAPSLGGGAITSPGILYGMMQGIPGIPRPPQHQPQQVPETALVFTGANTQPQQLVMNQQLPTEQMYGPVQGGLFVPPPHMQQQQHPSPSPQSEENADVNQHRKARSAAIPIKPPPEVAR